jgi:hypothetical protein
MTSPLVEPIAQALAARAHAYVLRPREVEGLSRDAADACIAVVAALPADYTAADVLAFLRGDDAPGVLDAAIPSDGGAA